jgi:hypothetical protein
MVNWKRFNENLENTPLEIHEDINHPMELDLAVKHLTETIQYILKLSTNNKTIQIDNKNLLILPNEIVQLIKQKRKARRNYQKTKKQEHKAEYNKLNKIIKHKITKYKTKKWQTFCNSLNKYTTSDSRLWKKINSIESANEPKPPRIPKLFQNGLTIDQPVQISNIFASLLIQTFAKPEDNKFDNNFKALIESQTDTLFNNNPTEIELTNVHEIKTIIKNIRGKGAPGKDGITNTALKHLPENYLIYLANIVNASIKLSHFPERWKTAVITMIPKPMKDHKKPENYRPISLLNTLSKIVERVIQNRLHKWLDENEIITQYQSGFTKHKQTNDHLFRLIQSTLNGFIWKYNTGAIFVDIEKAFDKVWHEGLLYKLDNYQVPNYLGSWIKSYLESRTFHVKVGYILSDPCKIEAGVPQGSVLGPTLFNIFFNDISETNEFITEQGLFADDLSSWVKSKSLNIIEKKLKGHLDQLSKWSSKWRLNLSVNKTTYTIFNRNGKNINSKITLNYNNENLKGDSNPKFLGVTLDPGLKFTKHINNVKDRATKRLNMLKKIKGKNWGANKNLILSTYKTLIRSIIEYAPFVSIVASTKDQNKLEIIQNKAARLALNKPFRTTTKEILTQSKLTTINERVTIQTIKYLTKARIQNPLVNQHTETFKQKLNNYKKAINKRTILNRLWNTIEKTNND